MRLSSSTVRFSHHLCVFLVTEHATIAALDVLGSDALRIWGHQWVKILELVYTGSTAGFVANKLIGGPSPEGIAARSRLKLEVERILAGR